MTSRMIANLRRLVKHPRYITVIGVYSGMWWCSRCDAAGPVGTRVVHGKGCLGGKRPSHWGPTNESHWIPRAERRAP